MFAAGHEDFLIKMGRSQMPLTSELHPEAAARAVIVGTLPAVDAWADKGIMAR